MNLPNPKEESFDVKGIKGGRSKDAGLKEKNGRRFFSGYYFGLFQLI